MITANSISAGGSGGSAGFNAADVPSAYMYKTNNTQETTTISAINTPTKINATTTLKAGNLITMPSNNRLTIGGTRSFKALVISSFTSEPNTASGAFMWANNALNGTAIDSTVRPLTWTTTTNGEFTAWVSSEVDLDPADYLELFMAKETSTVNQDVSSMTVQIVFQGWL